jgi:hypothetical protein
MKRVSGLDELKVLINPYTVVGVCIQSVLMARSKGEEHISGRVEVGSAFQSTPRVEIIPCPANSE